MIRFNPLIPPPSKYQWVFCFYILTMSIFFIKLTQGMKKHTKIYLDFFGYDISSFIPCEYCGKQANDIHHIEARGMGGKNQAADVIENLMALCYEHHLKLGDKKQYEEELTDIHLEFMRVNGRRE